MRSGAELLNHVKDFAKCTYEITNCQGDRVESDDIAAEYISYCALTNQKPSGAGNPITVLGKQLRNVEGWPVKGDRQTFFRGIKLRKQCEGDVSTGAMGKDNDTQADSTEHDRQTTELLQLREDAKGLKKKQDEAAQDLKLLRRLKEQLQKEKDEAVATGQHQTLEMEKLRQDHQKAQSRIEKLDKTLRNTRTIIARFTDCE